MTELTVQEKNELAEALASHTAPWVTYGVHIGDAAIVATALAELDMQGLTALVVVLAARCPRPTIRPDDGDVDEIAVERAVAGEPMPLSGPERVAAARTLAARGIGLTTAARRLHVPESTMWRLYGRVGEEGAAASRLERELVRDPDRLEDERYAPCPPENGYWNRPATPRALHGQDDA